MFQKNKKKHSNTPEGMLKKQEEKAKRAERKKLKEAKQNAAFLARIEKKAKPKEVMDKKKEKVVAYA